MILEQEERGLCYIKSITDVLKESSIYISNGGLTYYSPSSGGNNTISLSNLGMPTKLENGL